MMDMGIVRGTKDTAVPFIEDRGTVYIRTHIRQVPEEPDVWEYREIQYSFQEYLQLIIERNEELQSFLQTVLDEFILSQE